MIIVRTLTLEGRIKIEIVCCTMKPEYNIGKVLEIADKITGICREPLCFEVILQKLFADYGLIFLYNITVAKPLKISYNDMMMYFAPPCGGNEVVL